MADDYFNSTKLLLLGNGTDGSTTFTDNSYTPKTVGYAGNAQIDTAIKKYGTGSIQFDGTGDYLTAGVAADWTWMHLPNAKWTFEAWVSATDLTSQRALFSTNAGSWSYSGVRIALSNITAGKVYLEVSRGVVSTEVMDGEFTASFPNDTAFHHVAITYDNSLASDNAVLYIDGIFSGFLSKTAYAPSAAAPNTPARIGGFGTTGNFKGYIDDLRITADVVRYTTNFTPPTEELPTTQTTITANASLTAPPPTLAFYGGASFALSSPSPQLSFYTGAVFDLSPPSPTLLFTTGSYTTLTSPSPRLTFYAHDSTGEQAAHLTAPKPTLSFYTGAVARNLRAPSPTLAATGTVTISAKAALRAPKPTLQATGTVTSIATANLRYGYVNGGNYGLTAFGGGFVEASAPSPTISAQATTGSVARFSLTAPSPALSTRTGAQVSVTCPSPRLIASAKVGGKATLSLTAPSPKLSVSTGARLALTAPSPALTATGYPCGATAHLTAPSPNLVGYGGAVCNITLKGKPTLQASCTTGGVASVAVTCPLFQLTASASIGNVATAHLVAPSPRMGQTIQAWLAPPMARLTFIGTAVVTATYEAYAVNLGHRPRGNDMPIDEVTRYTNFPFTHVVRYQNSYYGANSTGLYLLEGTTDNGTAIPWAVKTAMDDFKAPVKKTIASAYFSGRFGPASTVQLHAGEDTPNTYSFSTPRDTLAQNHRQVFGKGVKERYFSLGASGTGTCEIDAVELETHNMTRRI